MRPLIILGTVLLLAAALPTQDRIISLVAAPVPGKTLALQLEAPLSAAGRPYLIYWSAHSELALDLKIPFLRGLLRLDFAGLANPALFVGLTSGSGISKTSLPIPSNTSFLGSTIDLQPLEIDFTNFVLYLYDNDAVVTFVSGIGTSLLAEGTRPSTITGDFGLARVDDASMGKPAPTGLPKGAFQPIRHAGQRGFVEGFPADFVETPGTSSIDIERGDRVARRLVNGIQQSISLPNGIDLAILRHAANCRDFSLLAIEAAAGRIRELSGSRLRDSTLSCPPRTRFSLYRPDFAFSDDGQIALAVVRDSTAKGSSGPPDKLLLIHTDPSKTWNNGRNVLDLTPAGAGRFVDGGLVISQGRIVALAETASGVRVFSGPADGTATLSSLSIPKSGSKKTAFRARRAWRRSRDGRSLLLALGSGTAAPFDDDAYVLRGLGTSSANLVNVSKFPASTQLARFRRDTAGPAASRADISPLGTRVAFVSGSGDRARGVAHQLWIAKSDGSQAGSLVSPTATMFDAQVDWIGSLHFVSETRLLFLAGEDPGACDWYAYDPISKTLTNVSKTATGRRTSKPFTQGGSTGNVASRGTFLSRNGRFVYFVRGWGGRVPARSPATNNLVAIDSNTLTLKDITGNDFQSGGTAKSIRGAPRTSFIAYSHAPRPALELQLRRAPGTSTMAFFVAEAATSFLPTEVYDCNVFSFDIENASVAQAVTKYTQKGQAKDIAWINQLTISPDGSQLAYALRRGLQAASEDVYVVASTGSTAARKLSRSLAGQSITDGSIRFTGKPIDALIWSRGRGSISLPFLDTVAEWSHLRGQVLPFVLSASSRAQRVVLVLSASPKQP